MRFSLAALAVLALSVARISAITDLHGINHVLMISVDGMHQSDLDAWIKSDPHGGFATLAQHGVEFTNAWHFGPSDSFPGLLALVTGGTAGTTGVRYDDSYDRSLYPPGSDCTGPTGTEVLYDETIDLNETLPNGGGGIDESALPLDAQCNPVYPYNYTKVNTIFEVVKAGGGYTAWCDKHVGAYTILNGPSGEGVDDLCQWEIGSGDSLPVNITLPAKGQLPPTFVDYEDAKVNMIVNQIMGVSWDGKRDIPVPNVFGMDFQIVSVAQKDPLGGYNRDLTPSTALHSAFQLVDDKLAEMVTELKAAGIYNETVVIITSKHGQSPIDPTILKRVNDSLVPLAIDKALDYNGDGSSVAQATCDDVCLIWLDPAYRGQANKAASALTSASNTGLVVEDVLYGNSIVNAGYPSPSTDNRTPDLIVKPAAGVVYTTSLKKTAEHGGYFATDRHVPLLLSNPHLAKAVVDEPVWTNQVAATILELLGYNPNELQAVVIEPHDRTDSLVPYLMMTQPAASAQAVPVAGLFCACGKYRCTDIA